MATHKWTAKADGPVRLRFTAEGHYKITATTDPTITRATVTIDMPDRRADQLAISDSGSVNATFTLPTVNRGGGTTIIGNGNVVVSRSGGVTSTFSGGGMSIINGEVMINGVSINRRGRGVHIDSDEPVYVNGRRMVPADGEPEQAEETGPKTITVTARVPAGSSIFSDAAAGDFHAETVDGAHYTEVDATTRAGSIYAGDVNEFTADTSQGDVTATKIMIMGALKTSQGNISVGRWLGTGHAKTSQGNISVRECLGRSVDLKTSQGSVTVHGGGRGSAKCKTSMGNVTITKDVGSEFTATGKSDMGSVRNAAAV